MNVLHSKIFNFTGLLKDEQINIIDGKEYKELFHTFSVSGQEPFYHMD